jgi:hypothetical protein
VVRRLRVEEDMELLELGEEEDEEEDDDEEL